MSASPDVRTVRPADFKGVVNFRDFGGHVGAGGRRVVTGRLFRSGHLGEATAGDLATMARLDLRLVADLRRAAERGRLPSRWPQPFGATVLEHAAPLEAAVAPHFAYLGEPGLTEDDVAGRLAGAYRNHPFDPHYTALFSSYLQGLAQTPGAVLVHCHAGKDRTGMLVGFTLHILGVSYDDIMADYLATNLHTRLDERMPQLAAEFLRDNGKPVVEPLLRRLMAVERGYLDATFETCRARHGSVDEYLAAVLGVTPDMREALRARYLER